jgi:acyl dehydratase
MATVFASPKDLAAAVGRPLGTSDWLEITQERIDRFAEATGDHQWIHVDPVRAAQGPFGRTIAHGYLTQSLVNHFLPQIVEVRGISMGVNYGADRLRFPAPVPVGSRVRGRAELVEVESTKDGAVQAKFRVTVEIEGGDRPGCVIDTIARYYPAEEPR